MLRLEEEPVAYQPLAPLISPLGVTGPNLKVS